MPSNERILSAASRAARSLGYCELREKQAEVLEKFVSGHDVRYCPLDTERACAMLVSLEHLTCSSTRLSPAL